MPRARLLRPHLLALPPLLRMGLFLAAPLIVPLAAGFLPRPALAQENRIVAVVNGAVITRDDVENREKLFAHSTGLHVAPETLDRLAPQITNALVDERLQLQEMLRRKIVVPDQDIASAIGEIEQRNNMKPGALRASLANEGVAMRTLVDQLRVQLGWTRVLRDQLGEKAEVSPTDIADRLARLKAETGQPEYRVSEIYIPFDQPGQEADAQRFADTVISQLHAGAPFAIVAAEFSAGQSALAGGDMGWVRADSLDPAVAQLVTQMPIGAVSTPIRVPGGFVVATVHAKREIGHADPMTILHVRQVFFPFPTQLNPAAPTPAQQAVLEKARQVSASVKSCDEMEAANKSAGSDHPVDPGELVLERIPAAPLRNILGTQPIGKATQPLVAQDGIAVIMVCSRETRTVTEPSKDELSDAIINERADLASRQLLADLRRRAVIDRRSTS